MLVTGYVIDKNIIIDSIYTGPHSEVYLAKDAILNVERAIKVLPHEKAVEIARSIKEAQLSHKCSHKHIVSIFEANAHDIQTKRCLVISMEYLPNGSAHQRLASHFISCQEAVAYIIDILKGLSHAHSKGVVHGDIKPANVMLCEKVGAKLSDFGLAIDVGTTPSAKADYAYMTHMAPELFQKNGSTTFLSDIFAAGSTLFRLTNNIYDWNGIVLKIKDYMKHLERGTIIGNKIQYEPFIPLKLKRIINKACAPDPQNRFKNVQELMQQLERLSPNIDWVRDNDTYWTGRKGNSIFEIEIIKKRDWKVEIKMDNRRIRSQCKKFSSLGEAEDYLYTYVANTTYN